MCLTLYMGSNTTLPVVLWDENDPRFYTRRLDDSENDIRGCLNYPEVIFVGSDQKCSCGFRHALLTGQEWFPVTSEDALEIDNARKNHQDLYDYVSSNVKKGRIEILACWNDDADGSPQLVEEINCVDLINEDFYFKEGGIYTIVI